MDKIKTLLFFLNGYNHHVCNMYTKNINDLI